MVRVGQIMSIVRGRQNRYRYPHERAAALGSARLASLDHGGLLIDSDDMSVVPSSVGFRGAFRGATAGGATSSIEALSMRVVVSAEYGSRATVVSADFMAYVSARCAMGT